MKLQRNIELPQSPQSLRRGHEAIAPIRCASDIRGICELTAPVLGTANTEPAEIAREVASANGRGTTLDVAWSDRLEE